MSFAPLVTGAGGDKGVRTGDGDLLEGVGGDCFTFVEVGGGEEGGVGGGVEGDGLHEGEEADDFGIGEVEGGGEVGVGEGGGGEEGGGGVSWWWWMCEQALRMGIC